MVYTHSGTLFSHREGILITCYYMDEPWKHYAKWKGEYCNNSTFIKYLESASS